MMKKSIPWIALGIALIDLTIIIVYVFVNDAMGYDPLHCCSDDKHTDVIGIIVSSVALVVSIYFVIMGLHARTIKTEFENDIKKIKEDFGILQTESNRVATLNAKVVYDGYSSAIEMLRRICNNLPLWNKRKNKGVYLEHINKIKLARSRFVCNTSSFHEKGILLESINIMKEKSKDIDDLKLLNKVIANPINDEDTRNAASEAYIKIKDRLGSTSCP